MTRRLLAITVAIVLAALGTIGAVYYGMTAQSRAEASVADPIKVAVTKQRIDAGTKGSTVRERQLIEFKTLPKAYVPEDALTEIPADLDNLVITSTVPEKTLLLRGMFGTQNRVSSGLVLPAGKMAVTVQTGAPQLVAGYVQPGAQVAIFFTGADKTSGRTVTKVLLPKVEVLAVGPYTPSSGNATGQAASADGALMLTVAVNQAEAERLIQALNIGKLYLGLLTDSIEVKPGPGVDDRDSGSGTSPMFR